MHSSGGASPRPEAILEWLQGEVGYPGPLPSPEVIQKVCRGNMVPVWSLLLQRIRSERTAGTLRRNILVHGVSAASGTREKEKGKYGLEERENALRERDSAEEEANRVRSVVRRQRKELRARMADIAREETERKRVLDERSSSRYFFYMESSDYWTLKFIFGSHLCSLFV